MLINQFPLNSNSKTLNEVIKPQNSSGKIQTSSLNKNLVNSTKPINNPNKPKEGK